MFKSAHTCLAVAVLSLGSAGAANAETTFAHATFSVANKCSVSGAVIDLGIYRATDTVRDVGNRLGYQSDQLDIVIPGATALGAVTYGEVTCDAGMPYTLTITGAAEGNNNARLDLEKGALYLQMMVRQIGVLPIPNSEIGRNGFGRSANPYWNGGQGIDAIGEGRAQPIVGNVIPVLYQSTSNPPYLRAGEQLGKIGAYSAKFLNTISF